MLKRRLTAFLLHQPYTTRLPPAHSPEDEGYAQLSMKTRLVVCFQAFWREFYMVVYTFLSGGGLLGNLDECDWNFSARMIIITLEAFTCIMLAIYTANMASIFSYKPPITITSDVSSFAGVRDTDNTFLCYRPSEWQSSVLVSGALISPSKLVAVTATDQWQNTLQQLQRVRSGACQAATLPTHLAESSLWSSQNCDNKMQLTGDSYYTASGAYVTATPDLLTVDMYGGDGTTLLAASQKYRLLERYWDAQFRKLTPANLPGLRTQQLTRYAQDSGCGFDLSTVTADGPTDDSRRRLSEADGPSAVRAGGHRRLRAKASKLQQGGDQSSPYESQVTLREMQSLFYIVGSAIALSTLASRRIREFIKKDTMAVGRITTNESFNVVKAMGREFHALAEAKKVRDVIDLNNVQSKPVISALMAHIQALEKAMEAQAQR